MTLVELGVVLTVIAVLAAVTVPQSMGWVALAQQEASEEQMAQLVDALSIAIASSHLAPAGAGTSRVELCTLPASTRQALELAMGRPLCRAGGFSGRNPATNAPYFVRLERLFAADSAASDTYAITLDTCVPFTESALRSDVTVDCAACDVDECRLTLRSLSKLSESLQALRTEKRDQYCCELVSGVGGVVTDCSNWNHPTPSPWSASAESFPGPGSLSERMARFCR